MKVNAELTTVTQQQQSLPSIRAVSTPNTQRLISSTRKYTSFKKYRRSENNSVSSTHSVDSRKRDGQNSTTPYNTRGSSKHSRSISFIKVNSNTTGRSHSAHFRQRLPFMDNVADQENSSTSVGDDHSASVVSTNTPKSHQSQPNFKQQHLEPRPATPFSLRKQIALALELSRDPIKSQTDPPLESSPVEHSEDSCSSTGASRASGAQASTSAPTGTTTPQHSKSARTSRTSSPSVSGSAAKKLHRNNKGETPLHIAAIRGDFVRIQEILKLSDGVDVNVEDNAGWTPLHEACNRGHTQAVRVLINYGADVNAVSECGTTPLVDASANNHPSIVKLLLKHGADPRIINRSGHNALSLAATPTIESYLREKIHVLEESNISEPVVLKGLETAENSAPVQSEVPTTASDTSSAEAVASSSSSGKLGITSISELKSVIHLITLTNDNTTVESPSLKHSQEKSVFASSSTVSLEKVPAEQTTNFPVAAATSTAAAVATPTGAVIQCGPNSAIVPKMSSSVNSTVVSSSSSTPASSTASHTSIVSSSASTSLFTSTSITSTSSVTSSPSSSFAPTSVAVPTTAASLESTSTIAPSTELSSSTSSSVSSSSKSLDTISTTPITSSSSLQSISIKAPVSSGLLLKKSQPSADQTTADSLTQQTVASSSLIITTSASSLATPSSITLLSSNLGPSISSSTVLGNKSESNTGSGCHHHSLRGRKRGKSGGTTSHGDSNVSSSGSNIFGSVAPKKLKDTFGEASSEVHSIDREHHHHHSHSSHHESSTSLKSTVSSLPVSSMITESSAFHGSTSDSSAPQKVPPLRIILPQHPSGSVAGATATPMVVPIGALSHTSAVLSTSAGVALGPVPGTMSSSVASNAEVMTTTTATGGNAKYPYVVSTTANAASSVTAPEGDDAMGDTTVINSANSTAASNESGTAATTGGANGTGGKSTRITRSSQRVALQQQKHHSSDNEDQLTGGSEGSITGVSGKPHGIGTRKKKNRGGTASSASAISGSSLATAGVSGNSANAANRGTGGGPAGGNSNSIAADSSYSCTNSPGLTGNASSGENGAGPGEDSNGSNGSNGEAVGGAGGNGGGGAAGGGGAGGGAGPAGANGSAANGSHSSNVYHYNPSHSSHRMYLTLRDHVKKRRLLMEQVPPDRQIPQFDDYMMNKGNYLLASNADQVATSCLQRPPATLPAGSALHSLFTEQERERHRMRLRHQVEQDKMRLTIEQEYLRLYCRAAHANSGKMLPLSVCTYLKDEELYNLMELEKDPTVDSVIIGQIKAENPSFLNHGPSGMTQGIGRIRFNSRLFLSWQRDLVDKWAKLKTQLIARQRAEAESLSMAQRMKWQWKVNELAEMTTTPGTAAATTPSASAPPKFAINGFIDHEAFVPAVKVVEDFDLLPTP